MSSMLSLSWSPLVGHEGWPPNIKPSPGDFVASTSAQLTFFFIAGAAVVIFALPWAIRAAVRSKNYTPLLVIGSGLLCSQLEPMLDMLGHLHWAKNLVPAFTNFGITVPALIPLCYVAFLGLESYFCYFVIRNGAHVRHFVMLLALGIVTDALMETIGINLGRLRILRCTAVQVPQLPVLVGLHQWRLVRHRRRDLGLCGAAPERRPQAVVVTRGADRHDVRLLRGRLGAHSRAQLDTADRGALGGHDHHDGDDGRLDVRAASSGWAATVAAGATLDSLANLRVRKADADPRGSDGHVAEDV